MQPERTVVRKTQRPTVTFRIVPVPMVRIVPIDRAGTAIGEVLTVLWASCQPPEAARIPWLAWLTELG
mgnify:CR=1 FL=1